MTYWDAYIVKSFSWSPNAKNQILIFSFSSLPSQTPCPRPHPHFPSSENHQASSKIWSAFNSPETIWSCQEGPRCSNETNQTQAGKSHGQYFIGLSTPTFCPCITTHYVWILGGAFRIIVYHSDICWCCPAVCYLWEWETYWSSPPVSCVVQAPPPAAAQRRVSRVEEERRKHEVHQRAPPIYSPL